MLSMIASDWFHIDLAITKIKAGVQPAREEMVRSYLPSFKYAPDVSL